jgi:hypothetical protein
MAHQSTAILLCQTQQAQIIINVILLTLVLLLEIQMEVDQHVIHNA